MRTNGTTATRIPDRANQVRGARVAQRQEARPEALKLSGAEVREKQLEGLTLRAEVPELRRGPEMLLPRQRGARAHGESRMKSV